jgi:polyhydroxyalkanoate synthesis regulator phasin
MAQNELIKRYLDAGMAFTQMTQAKAEAIVRDLVQAGEVQAGRTEDLVGELLERSRRNTEALLELIRTEVRDQLVALGVLGEDGKATGAAPAKQAAAASGSTKKAAKKAASKAKKAGAKKSAAKKSAAKRSASKKKAGAKKSAAKKKAPAKKAGS